MGNDIPRWEMIFHGGKWWDLLLAYPASTPIHKDIHKGGVAGGGPPFMEAAEGRLPYGWVSGGWVGKEEIPPW